jgi:hypothetical protein
MEAFTGAGTEAGVTSLDVRDLIAPEFAALADKREIVNAIPDLARLGKGLQARSILQVTAPIDLCGTPAPGSAEAAQDGHDADGYDPDLMIRMHGLRLAVEIKSSPSEPRWIRCAEFDMQLSQRMRLQLQEPGFETRSLRMSEPCAPSLTIDGRFADGYFATDHTLHTDRIAKLFLAGWRGAGNLNILQQMPQADLSFGTGKLRVAEMGWCEPFLMKTYLPASTRLTNPTDAPIEYSIRNPLSVWTGPFTLKPGYSHDFPVSYPLQVRLKKDEKKIQNVPMGAQYVLEPPAPASDGKSATSRTVSADARD